MLKHWEALANLFPILLPEMRSSREKPTGPIDRGIEVRPLRHHCKLLRENQLTSDSYTPSSSPPL